MFIIKADSILNRSKKKVNTRYNSTRKLKLPSSSSGTKKSYNKASYNQFKKSKSYAKIKGIVSKKSEVVVKVTGYSKGKDSVKNNLLYVSRNYKIEVHNEKDQIISEKEDMKSYFNDFIDNSQRGKPRENSRDTAHLSLSFPEASNDELLESVKEFAEENFKGHEYLYALHDEEEGTPHVHLIIQCRSKDLKKTLRINKEDIEKFRDSFSEKLNEKGLESNATSRQSRVNFKKPLKQIEYHSKQKKIRAMQLEGVKDLINDKAVNKELLRAKEYYREIEKDWIDLADELKPYDAEMSKEIQEYLEETNIESRQESLLKEVIKNYKPQKQIIENSEKKEEFNKDQDLEI